MSRLDTAGDTADLIEHYFEQRWTDGLPVVPPTPVLIGRHGRTRWAAIPIPSKPASPRAGAT